MENNTGTGPTITVDFYGDMQIFDTLPSRLRKRLTECHFNYSAGEFAKVYRDELTKRLLRGETKATAHTQALARCMNAIHYSDKLLALEGMKR